MSFRIRMGSVPGREHLRLSINNQDGFRIGNLNIANVSYCYGVVCDGCSAGLHNEVGAQLMANYICNEIPLLLSMNTPIQSLPQVLYTRCIGYLQAITSLTVVGDASKIIDFIVNHLLCTVMGFVVNEGSGIIFTAGDGVIVLNNEITRIDQKNQPMYPAYHLIDRRSLDLKGGELPQGFSVYEIIMPSLNRLAICSDGIEEPLINGIWGHEHQLGLQRFLKRESVLHQRFDDDCTVIAVEKIKSEKEGCQP